ncbi:hypothetical protein B0H17DRAFT_228191 [Mycena rosella]|uniref:Uncharacterized protein n=1 Tax=Mycena rosella TaxID=1033263 RepID=A0AAD7MBL9_MYCRO|nr:hypothetical protein B0H17DRAFT_228191 [Mycena rosella]
MFKSVCVIVLAAVHLGSFYGVTANPDPPTLGTLERRDTSSFFASQVTLQTAANVLAADHYSGAFPPNIPELEGIAAHIKNCSDAYDAAIIQLATTVLGGFLTASDAATLNTTYVPSSLLAILANLNTLQAGKAFFEGVNNNPLLLTMFCHWIGDLSRHTNVFLGRLTVAAPSADYAASWSQLQSTAASQYQIWLTEDGFNCGGLF